MADDPAARHPLHSATPIVLPRVSQFLAGQLARPSQFIPSAEFLSGYSDIMPGAFAVDAVNWRNR